MTVKELHIEVEQKLQEQGSYIRDRIFPEAIDLALNQAQEQILKENVDENFSERAVKLKNIEPLIQKNLSLPTIIPAEANTVYVNLPADVLYIINRRAKVVTSSTCSTLPSNTTSLTTYLTSVAFPTSALPSPGPYYNGLTITVAGTGTVYTLPSNFTNRFTSTEQKYEVINHILETFNIPGSIRQAYWEYYNGTRYPNSFIFVSTNNGSPTAINADVTTSGIATGTTVTVYNQTLVDATSGVVIAYRPIKEIEGDLIYKAINLNSFTKPKSREPLCVRDNQRLHIYTAESFIVTNVYLDYIRKPKQISLVLDQSCELDQSIHRDVVERAVELLKKNIQDPTLQVDTQYNNLHTRT